MKQIILVTFLMMSVFANAQEKGPDFVAYDVFPAIFENLPTSKENSFEIPVNKKFTIKLHTTDSIHFEFSVIRFERYPEPINYEHLASHFSDDYTTNGTIEMYFCVGVGDKKQIAGYGTTRIVLAMKNRTDFDLAYDLEIQKNIFSKNFKPETNSGLSAGALEVEMWQDMLNDIRLSNFRIK